MKKNSLICLFVCACLSLQAQTNFVKNPGFEQYHLCPNTINRLNWCEYWSMPGDSTSILEYNPEYFNVCGNDSIDYFAHVPANSVFYCYPHGGNGMSGGHLYYNKTAPPPPGFPFLIPFNYRDNVVGRLYKNLISGKIYCVSFWVNLAEAAGLAHNKIGAYLDDGTIHTLPDTLGNEITTVKPQVYTNKIITDTAYWTKIEGNFIANGTEKYISIGNFFPNDSITIAVMPGPLNQYSYYLIDDVSVIPIDLNADAGKDSHAAPGMPVQIGRVGDTTAQGLDCKWYHKGTLIDSGAVISVNGSATVGAIDTYVVVQTVCGLVKTDTVTVTTVPVGIPLPGGVRGGFTVYPNPSNGAFAITSTAVIPQGSVNAAVYDLLGRVVFKKQLTLSNNETTVNLQSAEGVYILELTDEEGNATRQRIVIE